MLRLALLGGLHVSFGEAALAGFVSRKAQALLAYLAVTGRPHHRAALAGLLWGDLPEARAAGNLRVVLANLHDLLAAHLTITRTCVAFNRSSGHWLDVAEFEEACRQGRGEVGGRATPTSLERAVSLYRGDFLAGFYVHDAPAFEEWALIERERLRQMQLQALHALTRSYSTRGEYAAAIEAAGRLLALDPWREEAHRELMRLLALSGQRSAALAQYEQCRRLLRDELGLEPLEETTALYERLVHWETGNLVDWETGRSGDRSTNLPIYQFTNLPIYQFTNLPIYQFTNLPIYQFTNLPIYQSTNLPIYQFTNLPIYQFTNLPFTGRGAEHAALLAWWEQAQRGRLALVEGEAGVGKTRLVEEALRQIESRGATVLRGRCYEFGGGLPYQPIAEALRGYLRTTGTLGEEDKVTRRQGDKEKFSPSPSLPLSLSPIWLAELSRLLPEVRQICPTLPPPPDISGEAGRQRLFETVARFLRSIVQSSAGGACQRAALCLFLDDLHWADPSTLDLLHYLIRQLGAAPIWIVAAYRPEEVHLSHPLVRLRQGLERDGLVDRLVLAPLSAGAVQTLAAALVGPDQAAALGDYLYRESEGNPFFLVETVNSLCEQGALRGEIGRWQWNGSTVAALPAGLQGVVLQRVGRLTEPAQRLLTLAAIYGRPFARAFLCAVAGRDADAVDDNLKQYLLRRLIQQAAIPDPQSLIPTCYDFTHDKIRGVLYHAAGPQRAILHGQVLDGLERLYAGRLEPIVEQLAHHAEQAGDREKALAYLPLAAGRAARLYAHAEALGYYERALRLLAADDPRRWPLLLETGRVLRNLSRYDEALAACQQVVAGKDQHAALAAAIEISAICRSRLDYAEARAWMAQVERLLEALAPADPEGRRAQAHARQAAAEIERAQGNLARARELFEQGLACYCELDDRRGAAECLAGLGQTHLVGGRLEEAQRRFEEALAGFQALGDRRREAVCLRNLGTVAWRQGRHDAARQLFTASLEICRTICDREGEAEAIGNLGLAFIAMGKLAEARGCWEESAALCRVLGLEKQAARWLHNLGNLYQGLGLYAEAQRCLEESLAVDQAIGAKPNAALDLGWLGKLGLLRGAWTDASRYLEEAVALDEETGGSVEASWHYAWLAAASCELGDLARARACSEEAVRLAGAQGTPLGPFELAGLTVIALALADGVAALGFTHQALAAAQAGGKDSDIGLSEALLAAVHGSGLLADVEDPRPHFEAGLLRMVEVRRALARAAPAATTAWEGAYECATVLRRYGAYLLAHGEPERGRALLLEAQRIAARLGAAGELDMAARLLAGDPVPRLRW